jgi:hypothetical protein
MKMTGISGQISRAFMARSQPSGQVDIGDNQSNAGSCQKVNRGVSRWCVQGTVAFLVQNFHEHLAKASFILYYQHTRQFGIQLPTRTKEKARKIQY